MLKLTIRDVERDRIMTRFGSERELLDFVRNNYPATWGKRTLDLALGVLNASDLYEAKTEPHKMVPSRLPVDYLTHSQADSEDPWPRKG
jgi:hypothetical protein